MEDRDRRINRKDSTKEWVESFEEKEKRAHTDEEGVAFGAGFNAGWNRRNQLDRSKRENIEKLTDKKLNRDKKETTNEFPKEVLNKLKWTGMDLRDVKIYYVSRGSPEDIACKEGKDIVHCGKTFINYLDSDMKEVFIPYHRILRITHNKKILFNRKAHGVKMEVNDK